MINAGLDEAQVGIKIAWRIPMGRGAWKAIIHRVAKSQT